MVEPKCVFQNLAFYTQPRKLWHPLQGSWLVESLGLAWPALWTLKQGTPMWISILSLSCHVLPLCDHKTSMPSWYNMPKCITILKLVRELITLDLDWGEGSKGLCWGTCGNIKCGQSSGLWVRLGGPLVFLWLTLKTPTALWDAGL